MAARIWKFIENDSLRKYEKRADLLGKCRDVIAAERNGERAARLQAEFEYWVGCIGDGQDSGAVAAISSAEYHLRRFLEREKK